ncbi:MAG: hypothetical protein HY799_01685 [Nitrosomonadales bacterium]|nr:hypothetical protein [Nitrosomonadales bacterium]
MAIKIVAPKAPVAPDVSLILEHYPKVGEKIAVMWGSQELHKYLGDTIFDARGGRQGFPMSVVSALLRLFQYHSTLIPGSEDDAWDHVL